MPHNCSIPKEKTMTSAKAGKRPPIHMIDEEAETLAEIALNVESRLPEVSQLLLDEITRAKVHRPERIPPDVVTMHATVEFRDDARGTERTVQLVYPVDADTSKDRISILTPLGAGLIGMRSGQSILWPDRSGCERSLTIVKVIQATQPVREMRTAGA
jgi:regulator of nucleoside diphosphate kinase